MQTPKCTHFAREKHTKALTRFLRILPRALLTQIVDVQGSRKLESNMAAPCRHRMGNIEKTDKNV